MVKNIPIVVVLSICLIFFIIEAIVNAYLRGLVKNGNSFFRKPETIFDFFLIVVTLIGYLNYSGIEEIRILQMFRPIQLILRFKNTRIILGTTLNAVYKLKAILLFMLVILMIYSIIGVIFWKGDIHYRCRQTPQPENGDWRVIESDTRP